MDIDTNSASFVESELRQTHDLIMAHIDAELGLDMSREDLQDYPSLRNLNQDALLSGRLVHLLYPGRHTFGCEEVSSPRRAASLRI